MQQQISRFFFVALFAALQGLALDLRTLEGITVTVKMDMPASSDGVDIRGGQPDFRKVADGIREYGIGVHSGQSIMITKIIVKPKNIEVHLGGGGFGTFSDRLAVAAASSPTSYEGESRREKDVRDELKYTDDYWKRARLRRELDDLRRDRDRDNVTSAVVNAQTRQMVEANVMQKRAEAGSRFNIRFNGRVPQGAGTPQAIIDSLSKYVDFGNGSVPSDAGNEIRVSKSAPEPSVAALRKGMTVLQVEQVLGPAEQVGSKTEGSIQITAREYSANDVHVTAQFVGGVLVDYKITPR